MYTPSSPSYGEYMTVAEWMQDHAPTQEDYELIKEWLEFRNLPVTFDSSNRLVVAFKGSVKDFNDTFKTTLHICLRKNPQQGNPPFEVYCTIDSFTLPKFVAERTTGLLTADLPAATGSLPPEGGSVISDPPGPGAFDPFEIAAAYEVDDLYAAGFTGQGVKLGVIAAATYHSKGHRPGNRKALPDPRATGFLMRARMCPSGREDRDSSGIDWTPRSGAWRRMHAGTSSRA